MSISVSGRKRIGLFVSLPEMVHVRRITEGIRSRCEQYGYDLCIFAATEHVCFPTEEYITGETYIYELADLKRLDGVILDYASLSGDRDNHILKRIVKRLSDYPGLPVCSLESPLEGCTLIENDNEATLREICRHVIEVHGRKKICILTGQKDNSVAEGRLSVFLDEIKKHGLAVLPEHIVYGDFWYTGGDRLAEDIADGKVERPDAVICASDCMALGLIDKLLKRGIRVPEDVLVIGFDATDEGAVNFLTLSSFDPNDIEMGGRAVDYIRSVIEPEKPLIERKANPVGVFHPGASCGCESDPLYILKRMRPLLHANTYNYADVNSNQHVSVGRLMETYVLEQFTASKTVDECLGRIMGSAHLLEHYSSLYICLNEGWLDMKDEQTEGYPEYMRICVRDSAAEEEKLCGVEWAPRFETERMIPELEEERDKPRVFCFSPLHFNGNLLGYTVIVREISDNCTLNIVYRNWLRFVNNALEMIRSKNRLEILSIRDEMTGAYNRRGMYLRYKEMLSASKPGDSLFVSVADMDGLKYINDTFGHHEGDFGIKTICNVLRETAKDNEICIRSGGDEFFLIGIGKYEKCDEAKRAVEFEKAIKTRSSQAARPYNISASMGCVVFEDAASISLDSALSEADERMYNYKFRHRRHRNV